MGRVDPLWTKLGGHFSLLDAEAPRASATSSGGWEPATRPLNDVHFAVLSQLGHGWHRQLQGRAFDAHVGSYLCSLVEREVPPLQSFEKPFAAAWVSDSIVAIGTKCNSLVLLDVARSAYRVVPVGQTTCPQRAPRIAPSGIHAIAINPSGTLLATGGVLAHDGVVLDLTRDFLTVEHLIGHADILFGTDWITDRHVITGARDGMLRVWQLKCNSGAGKRGAAAPVNTAVENRRAHIAVRRAHKERVRDVRYHHRHEFVASIGGDAKLKLWDPHLQPMAEYDTKDNEVVALAVSDPQHGSGGLGPMAAVGSSHKLLIADARAARPALEMRTHDALGARSLSFMGPVLVEGGCSSGTSFLDLRTCKWLPAAGNKRGSGQAMPDLPVHHLHPQPPAVREVGRVDIDEDDPFRRFYPPYGTVPVAMYAQAWDTSGSKLFTCGGPLASGVGGFYMSLWS